MAEERNFESEAAEIGWKPQEQFSGDAAKWVDAKTFVERGEHVLPIVKATNERLRNDLTGLRGEMSKLEQALAGSQQTIKDLSDFHSAQMKEKVKETRERLIKEMTEARKNDDVEGEVRVQDELGRLNAAEAVAQDKEPKAGDRTTEQRKPDVDKAAREDPDFQGWLRDNSWFGADEDRTDYANAISLQLRRKGDTSQGRTFLNKVTEKVNTFFSGAAPRGDTKVLGGGASGGNGGGGNVRSNGRSFNDLPSDAKAQAQKDMHKFVGPNKLCADESAWQKYYAEQFFGSEQ